MTERLIVRFESRGQSTYALEGTCLEELGEDGSVARAKEMKSREQSSSREWSLPDSKSPLLMALAFVRVAQWGYVRIIDAPGARTPVFRESGGSRVVSQFMNLRVDARKHPTKQAGHHRQWLQEMLSLPGDSEELQYGGRLVRWFSVSQRPEAIVYGDLVALPPSAISVMIDGAPASESMLDLLESHLSFELGAGVPCHFAVDGIQVTGRPPSILPGWIGQEEECLEANEVFGHASILCVVGAPATGKTVFASYWLRRLIGNRKLRQKNIFSWSFSRQGALTYVRLPLTEFFCRLAESLDITLPEKISPKEKATTLLAALVKKPTLLFLDGIEATFASGSGTTGAAHVELDSGLAYLLRGIAEQRESFVLATSRREFAEQFKLPAKAMHVLRLKKRPIAEIEQFFAQYGKDAGGAVDSERDISLADLLRILQQSSPSPSGETSPQWLAKLVHTAGPPEGYCPALPEEGLSKRERMLLNAFLRTINGSLSELLLYIVCTCHDPIAEDDLLAVAADIHRKHHAAGHRAPNAQEWEEALDALLQYRILEQATRRGQYSVHPSKRNCITEGLKHSASSLWVAINRALADLLMAKSPRLPARREELPALVHAAIHLCQAGDRRRAFEEICFERLSQKLKGYAIFCLGEYEAGKGVIDAMLGNHGQTSVAGLPAEAEALCIHSTALCSRFLDSLELGLTQQREAWARAKLTKSATAMLPIGINLLRFCHIFGHMQEGNEVEKKLFAHLLKGKVFGLGNSLAGEEIVDGAATLSSTLALHLLYQGRPGWAAQLVLQGGIKECRNHGAEFKLLLPTFGRPWHALVLLEMGKWQDCEKAIRDGAEWGSDMVRFQQTGIFEWLAARTFSAKAKTLSGARRGEALASAMGWADKAMQKAEAGPYRWWKTATSLAQGQIYCADGQTTRAGDAIEAALVSSKEHGFRLLTVDALSARAELAVMDRRKADGKLDATSALNLGEQIGYGLRKPALRKLAQQTR